jgi:hypothetical protein
MVAVIGKACHAAALAVHLCSCVVVGLDDQAYVPACECHTFSHTEPKLLSLSVPAADSDALAASLQPKGLQATPLQSNSTLTTARNLFLA